VVDEELEPPNNSEPPNNDDVDGSPVQLDELLDEDDGEYGAPIPVDDLLDEDDREVAAGLTAERAPHARPVVASFITKTLIYLFVLQAGFLTIAYVGVVVGSFLRGTSSEEMELVTEAILRAVQVILPVTTTLLGVAIGYYFKEDITRAQEQSE